MPTGTTVYAAHDGTVTAAAYDSHYGNYVAVEKDGYTTKYAHMDSLSVSAGQQITKGTVIGTTGNTGSSTGSRLHIVREGITDIFGKGAELDGSEGVQTARKAKELLDSLAEYKPLAKAEELEECNYNMIDNVLNNEKPKAEQERKSDRISVKEKLAEKKAVIEQRDKAGKDVSEKGTEKKSGREI